MAMILPAYRNIMAMIVLLDCIAFIICNIKLYTGLQDNFYSEM